MSAAPSIEVRAHDRSCRTQVFVNTLLQFCRFGHQISTHKFVFVGTCKFAQQTADLSKSLV
ncbi:hypothetical protein WI93_00330 [Burkholderia vietnamiensis]|nr:hypothetical protein WJ02_27045 [Burkholderia vietnamiensis]KVE28155.1 hypothetical protein WI93_00330 [Burkholderia vietnamiensis]KVF12173.1 hypothetical protein WJ05_01925 [Burkholderia vietnamiensis]KVF28556.1 hypothetical protein WJ08_22870 [Burkholderia vietnamiensis]KVF44446.1 hypothetical protein WJ10_00755 [Burkholderia vietnamiensis]